MMFSRVFQGRLDWKNQPNPFRWFEGAPEIPLEIPSKSSIEKLPKYTNIYKTVATKPQVCCWYKFCVKSNGLISCFWIILPPGLLSLDFISGCSKFFDYGKIFYLA